MKLKRYLKKIGYTDNSDIFNLKTAIAYFIKDNYERDMDCYKCPFKKDCWSDNNKTFDLDCAEIIATNLKL